MFRIQSWRFRKGLIEKVTGWAPSLTRGCWDEQLETDFPAGESQRAEWCCKGRKVFASSYRVICHSHSRIHREGLESFPSVEGKCRDSSDDIHPYFHIYYVQGTLVRDVYTSPHSLLAMTPWLWFSLHPHYRKMCWGWRISSALHGPSSWTKNQIDVRQINRRKPKLIAYVLTGNPHRRGNSKDSEATWSF